MRRISAFAFAVFSVARLIAEPVALVQTHHTSDFTIKLPATWTAVPTNELARLAGAAAKIEPRYCTSELTSAFLDTNSASRFLPRILVYNQSDSPIGADQFHFVHRSRAVQRTVFESLGFGLEAIFHRIPYYDTNTHSLHLRFDCQDGEIKVLGRSFLTTNGLVNVYAYAPLLEFEFVSEDFEAILNSFELNPARRYDPKSALTPARAARDWLLFGGAMAVAPILGLAYFAERRFRNSVRSDEF